MVLIRHAPVLSKEIVVQRPIVHTSIRRASCMPEDAMMLNFTLYGAMALENGREKWRGTTEQSCILQYESHADCTITKNQARWYFFRFRHSVAGSIPSICAASSMEAVDASTYWICCFSTSARDWSRDINFSRENWTKKKNWQKWVGITVCATENKCRAF